MEKITGFYFDFHWQQEHLIGCVINDPLAVAYFADRSVCRGFRAYTQVETAGVCAGQTVVDFTPESREGLGGGQGTAALAAVNFYGKKANSVILTDVDREKFFRIFFSGILDKDEESLDLISALTGGIKG